jgi:hypothetical protein|tara:strand:+ start:6772 stop:7059 length:288 start_codon:yes stop_codon:yes gene_type:complete
MIINESYNTVISESKVVFAKRGNKVVKKFRCTVGKRKGRVVASPQQCAAPIDIKKRFLMKKTKASKGARMTKKAQKTKRVNPTSKIVKQLNKSRK